MPVNTRAGTISSGVPSGADFLGGLAEGQRLGLGEVVAQEQLMHVLIAVLDRVRSVYERDEVGRNQLGALVDQLVEGVLAVGAGSPQKISPVSEVTGVPSQRTDLPLDSMVSCCR